MKTTNYKDRALKTARLDNISERFLSDRENGVLMHDKGAFVDLNNALSAMQGKKNLLLCGETGRGKTYLAFELAMRLKEQTSGEARVYYNRASVLVSEFKGNFKNIAKTLQGVFAKESIFYDEPPTPCKFVIIDELHQLQSADEWEIINEIVMTAYDKLTPLCLIFNDDPKNLLNFLSKMAVSRLKQGGGIVVLQIKGVDLRGEQ